MKNVKKIPILVIFLLCVVLVSLYVSKVFADPTKKGEGDGEQTSSTDTAQKDTEKEKDQENESAELYDYDLSEYLTLGEVSPVKAEFDDPSVCTEEEVDKAVFQILLKNASFEEKGESGKAELYNRVTVDFSVLQNGKELEDRTKNDYEIVIGLQTDSEEDLVIGGALVGAEVGEQRKATHRYPDELNGDVLAGQKVQLVATVKKIERHIIPTLIDENVGEITGDTFSTVQEFRESVKQDILNEKKLAKGQAVWLAIKNDAEVKKFPERELQDTIDLYRKNYEELAAKFELTLEELVETYLESDMETFEADARTYAEEKVKNDMIMTQLVRSLNITLSDEEYKDGVKAYYEAEEGEFSSLEAFVEFYTEENLRRNLLWDKALKTAEEQAIPKK